MATTRGAVTDGHTGWDCPAPASLLACITGPGPGTLPAHHGVIYVIYVCTDHQAQAEARITAAGHTPDTEPAPPGHRRDPWPCGHITTYGAGGPHLADTLTTPATVAAADPWHVPPAPPAPPTPPLTAAETAARYTPAHGYATLVIRPDQIALGDITDHTNSLLVVTEITRRHATWTLGGYNPASPPPFYWTLRGGTDPAAPPLTRHVTTQPRIRIRRPATMWPRLPGHAKRITSHNPVKSGCYTLIDGYNAACGCGWAADTPTKSRERAVLAHDQHRAQAITDHTRRQFGDLAAIEELEHTVGDVLPWRWDFGTQARLHGLTTAQATARLTPWATALDTPIEHFTPAGDQHFLWVDSRPAHNGRPRLDIRAYPEN